MAIFQNPALMQLLYLFKKKKNGNHQDCGNYRPTAIATVVSKLFEQVIFVNIKNFLDTTDNQFSFKTKRNTDICVFLLKQAISYYITRGSPIFCVFFDASKTLNTSLNTSKNDRQRGRVVKASGS